MLAGTKEADKKCWATVLEKVAWMGMSAQWRRVSDHRVDSLSQSQEPRENWAQMLADGQVEW